MNLKKLACSLSLCFLLASASHANNDSTIINAHTSADFVKKQTEALLNSGFHERDQPEVSLYFAQNAPFGAFRYKYLVVQQFERFNAYYSLRTVLSIVHVAPNGNAVAKPFKEEL